MTLVDDLSLWTFLEFWTIWLPLSISPLANYSILGGFDYGYDDGEGQNCYDFVGLGLSLNF